MKNAFFCTLLACIIFTRAANAQSSFNEDRMYDLVSLGLGLGFDYGGIGGNIIVYPQKNIGLFFGGGYAIVGFGYNAGIKLRLVRESHAVDPFFVGMYGYNAVVYVPDNTQYNKIFYGPTFGAGIDLHKRGASLGYWTFAIMVPIRNSEVKNYMDKLHNNYGISLSSLFPVGISVGYKFTLN